MRSPWERRRTVPVVPAQGGLLVGLRAPRPVLRWPVTLFEARERER